MEIRRLEDEAAEDEEYESNSVPSSSFGAAMYASRFAANALRGVHRIRSSRLIKPQKPPEPDFEAGL